MHDVAHKLAAIATGGILAQWVAWRTNLPAIVLLLAGGFAVGPLSGWIDPAGQLTDRQPHRDAAVQGDDHDPARLGTVSPAGGGP